jgi:hypothetical protein
MQEELEQKSVAVSIKAAKLTAKVLAKALAAVLRQMKKAHNAPKKGRQSFKRLNRTVGGDGADIEIGGRIESFERFARKFDVSYHVEKNKGTDPPRWTVYFKSPHAANMTAAFKAYSAHVLARGNEKSSVRAAIRKFKDVAIDAALQRGPKHRERGERSGKGGPEL